MTTDNPTPKTWRERHALSIMAGVFAALFGLVIAVQVGC